MRNFREICDATILNRKRRLACKTAVLRQKEVTQRSAVLLQLRRTVVAMTLIVATLGLAGCTPEGLMVFGRTATSEDIPSEIARSVLPRVSDDDFRLLGTVGLATYYAVVLKGSEDPWCLLQVDNDGPAMAACAANPRLISYSSDKVVALSNERPDDAHDWNKVDTSFWVARLY